MSKKTRVRGGIETNRKASSTSRVPGRKNISKGVVRSMIYHFAKAALLSSSSDFLRAPEVEDYAHVLYHTSAMRVVSVGRSQVGKGDLEGRQLLTAGSDPFDVPRMRRTGKVTGLKSHE